MEKDSLLGLLGVGTEHRVPLLLPRVEPMVTGFVPTRAHRFGPCLSSVPLPDPMHSATLLGHDLAWAWWIRSPGGYLGPGLPSFGTWAHPGLGLS